MRTFTSQKIISAIKRQVYSGDKSAYVNTLEDNQVNVFSDNFDRADNSDVENGWLEYETGGSVAEIFDTQLRLHSNSNGLSAVFQPDIPADGIVLTVDFIVDLIVQPTANFFITVRSDLNAFYGGYGIQIQKNGTVNIVEQAGAPLGTGSIGELIQGDKYHVRMEIEQGSNWMQVFVWNDNDDEPIEPTASFNNGGEDYTPVSTGTYANLGCNFDGSFDEQIIQFENYNINEGFVREVVTTGYLRPLNEEQSSVNGVQFGLGFMLIVETDVRIFQGDKVVIEGVEYTVRGIANHDRGNLTRYKRALITKPEKQ